MSMLQELLTEELGDLLHAEMQLTKALPKMAQAANHPKLKEGFEKHLLQTENHAERLKKAFELLGEKPRAKECKAMVGLISEGQETIDESTDKDAVAADLALIAAAQKIEHYEISGYGTARTLARTLGQIEVADLLTHTLAEEERTDFLLTEAAKPILQKAASDGLAKQIGKPQTAGV